MPTTVQAALLGILQGLTEFLPVSSTAHLILGARLLGYEDPGGIFIVMIQLGSVFAVMWLYRAKILDIVTGLQARAEARRFAVMLVLATIPGVIAGAVFAGYVKRVLYYSPFVIAVSFVLGGIVMLVVERRAQTGSIRSIDHVPTGTAIGVGLFQAISIVPGVSRSGATIVGGMLLGLDRPTAAEFSFFLAMPLIFGAFTHDFFEARSFLSGERALEIGIGFAMAFLAALLVVKPFLGVVRRSGFAMFAWYRIALGAVLLGAVAAGWR